MQCSFQLHLNANHRQNLQQNKCLLQSMNWNIKLWLQLKKITLLDFKFLTANASKT